MWQTALCRKIKERKDRRRMVNWSEHTKHTLPFNCNKKIQDKAKVRKAPIDEVKVRRAHRRADKYQ